jgi:hypothetical protein
MIQKRIIKTVTVTGADDSIDIENLVELSKEFPYVEFGILLSKKQQGGKRFPSKDWLWDLYCLWEGKELALSGHMCGTWVRDLCVGKTTFFKDFGQIWDMFSRFQLNFHAENHLFDYEKLSVLVEQYFGNRPIIFQMDGVNENAFKFFNNEKKNILMQPLFDLSGGRGVLPGEWPKQLPNQYCGYAGGLSPDNVQKELEKISKIASGPIWIDAETLLRSNDDAVFDFGKVVDFLVAAKPWVILKE